MNWTLEPAAAFEQHRTLWDQANRLQGDHILLDSAFVGLLLKHFGSPATRLAVSAAAGAPALALVQPAGRGVWATFQPSQAPLGLVVLGSPTDARLQARHLLRGLPGYALGLSILQQDPDFSAFAGGSPDPCVERVDYIATARLTISGTWEDYWKARGKNLTHNLSRQRRRLGEKGIRLEVVAERQPGQVAAGVAEYGRIESQSWKAAEGTAVSPDNAQGRFYRELLEHYCAAGEGVIYRLLMDGKTVACDLCLERNGMLVVLKTTYDEQIAGLSLGLLLHESIFRASFDGSLIKVIEFYGRVRDWHTKWTDEVRTMYHLTLYRHAAIPWAARLARTWRRRGEGG